MIPGTAVQCCTAVPEPLRANSPEYAPSPFRFVILSPLELAKDPQLLFRLCPLLNNREINSFTGQKQPQIPPRYTRRDDTLLGMNFRRWELGSAMDDGLTSLTSLS